MFKKKFKYCVKAFTYRFGSSCVDVIKLMLHDKHHLPDRSCNRKCRLADAFES